MVFYTLSLALFSFIFRLFKQTIQILQQINVKKCPSSIQCRDLKSQPSESESPPLTTRPGLRLRGYPALNPISKINLVVVY